MEDRLRVGVITSPHGIHGEVKIFPTTDDPQRFKKLKKVIVDTHKEQKEMEIGGIKFFKNLVIATLSGIEDRTQAEKYRSADILIEREDALPLGEDEYYICDILGFTVTNDDGTVLGTLEDVLTSCANDVYVVKRENGKEILIPSTKECVLSTDLNSKNIVVHLLKGMI
ncbi:MAG: 16S rRNA processing protein RimM [Lachnospiraceae bacterium]|nr:16S rRNA processing protein RimM [Lachnospiraceae bacterium]MBO4761893.1 16S rRNA processing protein RimM [Lachnospiraceae bacterium]